MSIITFANKDNKETGQTLSVAAIAAIMAIEHNYKILLISTDFNDKTLENCFWNPNIVTSIFNPFFSTKSSDISTGLEGLVRAFASNRASGEIIKSYTKPILRERLDILPGPKTIDTKEYSLVSLYFSQIAEVAKKEYDLVLIDLSNKIPNENQIKLFNISDLIIMGLNQNYQSIQNFYKLKTENEFYKRNNVMLSIGKYDKNSKYSNKNIARYLKERYNPMIIPYNILFADSCSDGKIIDYMLASQIIKDIDNKDYYFYNATKDTAETIDYQRRAIKL